LYYRQILHLGHTPAVYLDGNNTYSINSDHLGTPLSLSNADGETVWSADYSPFGEATITTEQIQFAHRFPGQYFDPETGTHYNYFRDYNPTTGRYLSNDPIGLLGGNNRYAYVGANPLANIDFFGLDGTSVAGAVSSYDSPSISVERAIRIGGQLGQWAVRVLRATTITAGSSVAGPVVAKICMTRSMIRSFNLTLYASTIFRAITDSTQYFARY